jgi:hypothetical protein
MECIASYQAETSAPGHNSQHGSQEPSARKQTQDQARQKRCRLDTILEFVPSVELMVESPRNTEGCPSC